MKVFKISFILFGAAAEKAVRSNGPPKVCRTTRLSLWLFTCCHQGTQSLSRTMPHCQRSSLLAEMGPLMPVRTRAVIESLRKRPRRAVPILLINIIRLSRESKRMVPIGETHGGQEQTRHGQEPGPIGPVIPGAHGIQNNGKILRAVPTMSSLTTTLSLIDGLPRTTTKSRSRRGNSSTTWPTTTMERVYSASAPSWNMVLPHRLEPEQMF